MVSGTLTRVPGGLLVRDRKGGVIGALGVTVLSSDIGKLYVTLAQAIERLRE